MCAAFFYCAEKFSIDIENCMYFILCIYTTQRNRYGSFFFYARLLNVFGFFFTYNHATCAQAARARAIRLVAKKCAKKFARAEEDDEITHMLVEKNKILCRN